MTPIHELLSRIRWDPDFGNAQFRIGYHDRMEDRILFVDFDDLKFNHDDHFSCGLVNKEGDLCMIPLHRIKEVYRNDELIWQRTH